MSVVHLLWITSTEVTEGQAVTPDMVTVADADGAEAILAAWRNLPGGEFAAEIGELTETPGRVTLRGEWGGRRLLIVPDGEQLPRIC